MFKSVLVMLNMVMLVLYLCLLVILHFKSGDIDILMGRSRGDVGSSFLLNDGSISSATKQGGNVTIVAREALGVNGEGSGLSLRADPSSTGTGGSTEIMSGIFYFRVVLALLS